MKDLKEKIIRNKWYVIGFLAVWAITVFLTISAYSNTLGMESIGNDSNDQVMELSENMTLKQTMFAVDGAESLSVEFATYARKNEGNVFIKVIGKDSGKIYADETVKAADIQDNSFYTVSLTEKVSAKNDRDLIIELNSDSRKGKAVGVYYSMSDILEQGEFSCNGAVAAGDLVCKQLVRNEYYQRFALYVITFAIFSLSLIILLIAMDVRKEILFTLMVFCLGLIFMFIMTPMSVPDEQFHYESAYQITSNLFGEDHKIMDIAYRNYSHFGGHENVASAYKRLLEHFNDPLEMRNKYEEVAIDIDLLQYLVYFFPQTLGVLIGRVCKLNFLKTFYLGRFMNLLFFTGCVYLTIRKTPVLKTLLGMLACTPIFLQQCSSYSYDCFVNGLCLIVIAYFLKWMNSDEKITFKEALAVFLVVLGLSPAKKVYALFVLPFLFVPADRFGGKKNKILTLIGISMPAIYITVQMLLPPIMRIFNRVNQTYGDTASSASIRYSGLHVDLPSYHPSEDVDPSQFEDKLYTIGFIVEYPIHTIKLILRTVRFNLKKWFYDSIGRTLSGASLILPLRLIHLMTICLIISSLLNENMNIPLLVKAVILVMCVAIAIMILLGFLLTWTSRRDVMIQGVQGRYFSPLLPYFFSVFNNRYIKVPIQIDRCLIFAHVLMIFNTIIYILSFTFVN